MTHAASLSPPGRAPEGLPWHLVQTEVVWSSNERTLAWKDKLASSVPGKPPPLSPWTLAPARPLSPFPPQFAGWETERGLDVHRCAVPGASGVHGCGLQWAPDVSEMSQANLVPPIELVPWSRELSMGPSLVTFALVSRRHGAGPGLADKRRFQETLVVMWMEARPQRPRWKRET